MPATPSLSDVENDYMLLRRDTDANLAEGYRATVSFIDQLAKAGAHADHITKAREALSSAFAQAIVHGPATTS
ncbi:hypothetical protein [Streptomyces albidoflavus]|uniref:hypothetical protein n=1 Tax=Streptomyces albidoflavus TaxID=1886 RepID=UPI00340F0BD6